MRFIKLKKQKTFLFFWKCSVLMKKILESSSILQLSNTSTIVAFHLACMALAAWCLQFKAGTFCSLFVLPRPGQHWICFLASLQRVWSSILHRKPLLFPCIIYSDYRHYSAPPPSSNAVISFVSLFCRLFNFEFNKPSNDRTKTLHEH